MPMHIVPSALLLSQDCAFFTADMFKENNVLSNCSTPTLLKESIDRKKLSCNQSYNSAVKSNINSNHIKNSSNSNLDVDMNIKLPFTNDNGWKLVQIRIYKHKHKENDCISGRRESPGKKLTSETRLYDDFFLEIAI